MKLEKVLKGRAIRFIDHAREEKKPIPLARVTRAIQDRYQFLQAPVTLQDYNFETGVTFLVGRFENSILQRFQIYQRGLVCEAEASTDVCDGFFDDLTTWLDSEFQQQGKEPEPKIRVYTSQLVVQSETDLGAVLGWLDPLAEVLSDTVQSYGGERLIFGPSGLKMQIDATGLEVVPPAEFVFERRFDRPFADNIYYSAGPLRTQDHQNILERLERAMLGR
jgi:hypothetical protein